MIYWKIDIHVFARIYLKIQNKYSTYRIKIFNYKINVKVVNLKLFSKNQ